MQWIRWFHEVRLPDVDLVGGKNASLGELAHALDQSNIQVPDGFAITAKAYWHYLEHNNLVAPITEQLAKLDKRHLADLKKTGDQIRRLVREADMPDDLEQEIKACYQKMGEQDVAVRSSATAEDLPGASFAGQQETYLNIEGADHLVDTCKSCFASLFTDRAISYRIDKGFEHMKVGLSIGVQRMVRSDVGASGVIFTIDTETGFDKSILITSAYGLGENVVQGAVNPDEFLVFKPALEQGLDPILRRQIGEKAIMMQYADRKTHQASVKNVEVPLKQRQQFSIQDDDVTQLAQAALKIERHYSDLAGQFRPMDIEWAKDGNTGQLFILQARPETVHATKQQNELVTYELKEKGDVVCEGKSVGNKIAAGQCRTILSSADMEKLNPGEVLVTDITDPDWEPIMKIASAIVTNRGGRTCHAAIIARELGIPAIVGTGNATEVLTDGQEVTVSCAGGDEGKVFSGLLKFEEHKHQITELGETKTKTMMILGNPRLAFEKQFLPNDGVGLARLEFIISNTIGVHPNALLNYETLEPSLQKQIAEVTQGYSSPVDYYVDRLAEGVSTICAAFYPKPVVVRLSDFKSNEYAELLGGNLYEPKEENPMLGFRGASRYPSPSFSDAFGLECKAIKKVREQQGLSNLVVMIPFVRSVQELKNVLSIMETHGLKRGEHGLQVYIMCEVPSNALLADDFLPHCDGFSIGSNDLTQLTLGIDRDSALIEGHDERDPAVLKLMDMAISACLKADKYIGICGQAPSDFPEITEWLVEQGIYSIALNPDSVLKMRELIAKAEKK